jgi:hypothetical protein
MMTVPFGWRRFFVSITNGGDVNDWHELPLERLLQRDLRFANSAGNE